MKTLGWFVFLLAAASVGLGALDGALTSLGVDTKTLERMTQDQLRSTSTYFPASYLPRPVSDRFKAMTPDQKTATVVEALRLAKAVASGSEFAKAHELYINKNLRAVNHGIDLNAEQQAAQKKMMNNPEGAMGDMMKVAGAQIAQSYRKMDKASLKIMLDMDLQAGDAKLKKLAPMLESNFEEFRKQYSLWKSASMGGPGTEDAYQAALGQGAAQQDRQKLADEQRAWNEYNLKAMLVRRLDTFIATASTVDFAAQTRAAEGKLRFVNPKYESKSNDWKLMYRAGKEPVTAALEFARQWRKEL